MLFPVQLLATAALLPWTLAAPNVPPTIDVVNRSVCLRACFIDQPFCPGDMVPELLGPCWTCCLPTDTYAFPPEHGPNDQQ